MARGVTLTGGNVLAHGVTTRVWVERKEGMVRTAKLINSPSLPEAEADLKLIVEVS